MRWWTCDCLRLSMIGAVAAGGASGAARAAAGVAPLLPSVKPWKKARHVGSTESGFCCRASYAASMTALLAAVGREEEDLTGDREVAADGRGGGRKVKVNETRRGSGLKRDEN